MKRVIKCGYDPSLLDDYANRYAYSDLSDEEIWDEVYNETDNESLADDVLEAVRSSTIVGSLGLTRSAKSCQRDCKDAFDRFNGNIPIWKLQDIYHTYDDVDRQLINMWCKGR